MKVYYIHYRNYMKSKYILYTLYVEYNRKIHYRDI